MIQPYYNKEHTAAAVLVSSGYGAGWSSWNNKELAWDSRVVEFWLAHKDDKNWMDTCEYYETYRRSAAKANKEAEEFFESIGYDSPYMGGFNQIDLEWVPLGVAWRIEEYDGFESLVYLDNEDYTVLQ